MQSGVDMGRICVGMGRVCVGMRRICVGMGRICVGMRCEVYMCGYEVIPFGQTLENRVTAGLGPECVVESKLEIIGAHLREPDELARRLVIQGSESPVPRSLTGKGMACGTHLWSFLLTRRR
ncbi:hypothetical protein NFI96_014792 [Prochilodus magdalenae]|nr:hypothetical protein NFI96_014792 [Prochilodus magdalenae]